MSIYTKPLSQVVTADLQELLTEKAVENVRLEFKSEVPKKDDTLKKLSSFANTFGGFMVVGAKAKSEDGRVEDLPGVDEESGYKQKVVDWCFNGASPPLIVQVSDPIPVPSAKGKVCYVIHTAESEVAPHFLNGRKGVWVRTDEFSSRFEAQLANDNELRHLLDRRKLIRERRDSVLERARKRFDTFAASRHTDGGGHRTNFGPRLELCVVPRFPARTLCEQARLAPLIREKTLFWRGITFPAAGSTTISQHESAIVLGAAGDDSMLEASIWGMMFYCTKIADDSNPAHIFGIHLYGFVGTTMLFLRHAEEMLQALGYSGLLHIQMTLDGMRGIEWLHGGPGIYRAQGSKLDDRMEFSISVSREELQEKPDDVLKEILKYVFFSVNWPDLIDAEPKLQSLIQWGYQYNS
jgi:Putative DNA-binding domain